MIEDEQPNYSLFQTERIYSYSNKIGERDIEKCFELIQTYSTLYEAKIAQQEFKREFQLDTIIIPSY